MNQLASATDQEKTKSLKNITTAVYALPALSFLVGITLVIAVIIDYVKRDDARNTWLESHFQWQIRTFWYGLLWSLIGVLTYFLIIGYVILFLTMIWLIYRIAKGWLRLMDNQEVT